MEISVVKFAGVMPEMRDKIIEAVKEAVERTPKRNFKGSVDITINLKNVDTSKAHNRISEDIVLPNGRGRDLKIAVFAKGEVAMKAEKFGANKVLNPDEIEKLGKDKKATKYIVSNYDAFIAEVQYMPLIGKSLGRVLAPRDKMPTPLLPTADISQVIEQVGRTVRIRSKDKTTFSTQVANIEMDAERIGENIRAIIDRVEDKLEHGIQNIDSIYVKTTMGPAVRVI